jgi:energy-coupling factor transporter ATP-binding protein EcfA2
VEFSELRRFIDQKVKNYSSGMQVRLMFSVAIHANREILLMDEVLAVGDTNFQSKCLEKFNEYRDQGKTVILVTHDIGTIQRFCDRAMLLRSGKIEMIGDPEKVGNEYIYQNMSDEEKRIVDEERRQRIKAEKGLKNMEEKEGKNKVAEITRVEFLDKGGKEKNIFETGEDMSIRAYFEKNKPTEALNFGVAIFSQENHYALGINTIWDKVDTKKYIEKGYFQVDYRNIPLRTNTYYINLAIYGERYSITHDFVTRFKTFKVVSGDKNHGMINLDYHWN